VLCINGDDFQLSVQNVLPVYYVYTFSLPNFYFFLFFAGGQMDQEVGFFAICLANRIKLNLYGYLILSLV